MEISAYNLTSSTMKCAKAIFQILFSDLRRLERISSDSHKRQLLHSDRKTKDYRQ